MVIDNGTEIEPPVDTDKLQDVMIQCYDPLTGLRGQDDGQVDVFLHGFFYGFVQSYRNYHTYIVY